MGVIQILLDYHQALWDGIKVTLKLCAIIWSAGLAIGGALGVAGARYSISVGRISRVASFVLSGTPVLVLLFWLHYPAQTLLGIVVDPFYTAAVALSIINIFLVADSVRGSLQRFPRDLILAGRVCGMNTADIVHRIELPLVMRQISPSLLTIQVNMLQATLFASLISVGEIFRVAQNINAQIYRPIEIYSALAVFFLLICLPLNGTALLLQRWFRRDLAD